MLITASKRGDNTLRSCSNVFISSSPRIVRRTPRGITTSATNPESFCSIFGEVQLRFLFSIKCEKKVVYIGGLTMASRKTLAHVNRLVRNLGGRQLLSRGALTSMLLLKPANKSKSELEREIAETWCVGHACLPKSEKKTTKNELRFIDVFPDTPFVLLCDEASRPAELEHDLEQEAASKLIVAGSCYSCHNLSRELFTVDYCWPIMNVVVTSSTKFARHFQVLVSTSKHVSYAPGPVQFMTWSNFAEQVSVEQKKNT